MKDHQRPVWIIVFAILMASIAIRVKAQGVPEITPSPIKPISAEPTEIGVAKEYTRVEFNGQVHLIEKSLRSSSLESGEAARAGDGSKLQRRASRPKYATLDVSLANFDADEDPDGWVAHVILFGSDDRPAGGIKRSSRCRATFELTQRVPTQDFTGYVSADSAPVKWSTKLEFDENGVAKARLPLRQPLDPIYGWSGAAHPAVGNIGGLYGSGRRGLVRHTDQRHSGATVLTNQRQYFGNRSAIGTPEWGQLRVRISVPSEGVFRAVSPIRLRPSVLVDTRWPYH